MQFTLLTRKTSLQNVTKNYSYWATIDQKFMAPVNRVVQNYSDEVDWNGLMLHKTEE